MITGVDNIFYSTKPMSLVEDNFLKQLNMKFGNHIKQILEFEEGLETTSLIAASEEILEWHEENGFSLNEEGKSAFLFIGRKYENIDFELNDITHHISLEKNGLQEPEPYSARLIQDEIWMYDLVTPNLISECDFSKNLYLTLVDVLRGDGDV